MPVRKPTVSEEVYRALKRDILTLKHPPGSALREQDLAEKYGSSRVPVREACRRLQQEGLVGSVPYRGYHTAPVSLKGISDLFELRLLLEAHVAETVVDRIAKSDLDRLEALASAEYSYDDWESYEAFLERNREFHLALAEISGNAELLRVLGDVLQSMQRYFFLGLDLGDYGPEMREEHQRLTTLLSAGDRAETVKCVRGQIERSRKRITEKLMSDGAELPLL